MAFNGSGVFQIDTAGQPVVTNTTISSTAHNAYIADVATGLSTCVTKDGQTTTTAVVPFAAGLSVSGGASVTQLAGTTYSPTITAVTNIDSATAVGNFLYSRINNIITVSGQITIDATAAAATASEVGISLPVASDFTQLYQCNGTGVGLSGTDAGKIRADATNNRASLTWNSGSAASQVWTVTFQYQVV